MRIQSLLEEMTTDIMNQTDTGNSDAVSGAALCIVSDHLCAEIRAQPDDSGRHAP